MEDLQGMNQDQAKEEERKVEQKIEEVTHAVATIKFFKERKSILDITPPILLEGYKYNKTNIDEMNKVFWPIKFTFQPDGSCLVEKDEFNKATIIPGDYVVRDVRGMMLFIHEQEFEKRFEEINL